MKKYLGVKIVSAESMSSDAAYANNLLKAGVVESGEKGYKVVYEDGYESWSPKEVFEKAYKAIYLDPAGDPEDAFISLEVDIRTGEWDELPPEELKAPQPESLSRIDLLKQFALSQALVRASARPTLAVEDILNSAEAFYKFLLRE